MIGLALFLLVLTVCLPFFVPFRKEGMKEPFMNSVIESIKAASKDSRMRPDQKIALQDALSYAMYIKNI
jgi:hypothetical protein